MQEMRKGAVKGLRALQKFDDVADAFEHAGARQESTRRAGDQGHDAETGAAAAHGVEIIVARHRVAALARHGARRMGEIPEVVQGLPLHQIEQFLVGWMHDTFRLRRSAHASARHSIFAADPMSELGPIWITNTPGSKTCSAAVSVSARKNRKSSAVIRKLTKRSSPGC